MPDEQLMYDDNKLGWFFVVVTNCYRKYYLKVAKNIIRPSSLQRKKMIIMKNKYRFLMSKVNNLNFILCEENMYARSLLSLLSH
jgi:hypothetical protein